MTIPYGSIMAMMRERQLADAQERANAHNRDLLKKYMIAKNVFQLDSVSGLVGGGKGGVLGSAIGGVASGLSSWQDYEYEMHKQYVPGGGGGGGMGGYMGAGRNIGSAATDSVGQYLGQADLGGEEDPLDSVKWSQYDSDGTRWSGEGTASHDALQSRRGSRSTPGDMAAGIVSDSGPSYKRLTADQSSQLGALDSLPQEDRKGYLDMFTGQDVRDRYPGAEYEQNNVPPGWDEGAPLAGSGGGGGGQTTVRVGDVISGYEFLGGDPSDPDSWRKVR